MLLYIAIITYASLYIAYASLYIAAMLGVDTTGGKILITAGAICGGVVATLLYLAALRIYEM